MSGDVTHWVTQRGQVIAIEDMDDTHLWNAYNMVLRRNTYQDNPEWRSLYGPALLLEILKRQSEGKWTVNLTVE